MDEHNIATGKRITDLRLSRKMTREKLAEAADISVQFLSDIEKGRKSMTVATLRRICKALHVTTDYIVNNNTISQTSDEIQAMINTLTPTQQLYAKELIHIFIQSHEKPTTE